MTPRHASAAPPQHTPQTPMPILTARNPWVGPRLSKKHRFITSRLLFLERGCLFQALLHSYGPTLFPGNRPREGRGLAQGHTVVWTGAAGVQPQHTRLGPVAPNPQAGRLQGPRGPRPRREFDLPLPPHHPVEGGGVVGPEKRPPLLRLARLQLFAPGPPPQEFNPLPTEGRAEAPHSRPGGT